MASASLAGALKSIFDSHPDDPAKPVVDYSLALILSPGMLIGSSIGRHLALSAYAVCILIASMPFNFLG